MARNPLGDLGNGLGDYLREQRLNARLSVRQLSELAGISNPYLSQIERGLKRPSAEILQQIAKGLSISAETLYVQAGLLDPDEDDPSRRPTAREAISADIRLSSRQKQTLIDIYDSFVGSPTTVSSDAPAPLEQEAPLSPTGDAPEKPARRPVRKAASKATTAKKTAQAKKATRTAAKATKVAASPSRGTKKTATRRAARRAPSTEQS